MSLRPSIATLFIVLVIANTRAELMWEIGDHLMNVIEQPIVHAENVMLNAQVYEYEARVPVGDHDALKQLENMVLQDDQRFAQNIVHKQQVNEQKQENERSADSEDRLRDRVVYEFVDIDGKLDHLDDSYVLIEFEHMLTQQNMQDLVKYLSEILILPLGTFQDVRVNKNVALIRVDRQLCQPTHLIDLILKYQLIIMQMKGYRVINCDLAIHSNKIRILKPVEVRHQREDRLVATPILILLIVAPVAFAGLLGVAVCMVRRRRMQHYADDEEQLLKSASEPSSARKRLDRIKNFKPSSWMRMIKQTRINGNGRGRDSSPTDEYQDLCRQRMESNTDKCSPISSTLCSNINTPAMNGINSSTINSTPIRITNESNNESERNSSWTEESTKSFSVDIKTGHVILDFLEKHLLDKNLLDQEWKQICKYEAEPNKSDIGRLNENRAKNRNPDLVPYDHSRVKLKNSPNDYINASFIIDHDPKNPSYITTQSPLSDTLKDFWTMVWQRECTTIVTLCNSDEYDSGACVKYWPDSSHHSYGCFEIHLVSVHIWCEDYLIRNFLLKNTETNKTRAITQFHFQLWPTNGVPTPVKSILEFRRKVLKSHNNSMSPMIVHCNDGVGRTGAYLLIDMVINKIVKGAKEIDLSATLEYLRDQRAQIVTKKYLYEYAFEAITEKLKQLLE